MVPGAGRLARATEPSRITACTGADPGHTMSAIVVRIAGTPTARESWQMAVTTLTCPSCRATLRPASEIPAGKRIKCPKCNKIFTVGAEEEPVPAMAAIIEDDDEEQ